MSIQPARAEAKSIQLEASDGASHIESQPCISARSVPPESSYTWVAEHEQILGPQQEQHSVHLGREGKGHYKAGQAIAQVGEVGQ